MEIKIVINPSDNTNAEAEDSAAYAAGQKEGMTMGMIEGYNDGFADGEKQGMTMGMIEGHNDADAYADLIYPYYELRSALEEIASGKFSGWNLLSYPPKDPVVERAKDALAKIKEPSE